MNYLNDFSFLQQLNETKTKTVFAKIISLDIAEAPQEEIIGQVTGGSINVDGTSALRRTCSLSLIAKNVNLHSFYWGISTKFQLFIGLENSINSKYPKIIWFPQGIYIITNFSSSQSTNSYNISITGKDKMCLLDGSVGGKITANSIQFDEEGEEQDNGDIIYKKAPLQRIIYQLVNELGGEKISNIVINDLDDYGLELLNYYADVPLYMLIDKNNELYQVYIDGTFKVYYEGASVSLSELEKTEDFVFNNLSPIGEGISTPSNVKLEEGSSKPEYTVVKREKGETVGYRVSDLIYAGKLIANSGDSLTSVLDKIKNQLIDFEYFYDVYGRFIFQKRPDTLNLLQNDNIIQGNINLINSLYNLKQMSTYDLSNSLLVSSLSNSPNLLRIRNDYVLWGTKKVLSTGGEIPVHLRYSIHKKPTYYYSYYQKKEYTSNEWDWRELIYQMAIDYNKHSHEDDFLYNIYNAGHNKIYYPNGITSYEMYYTDMQSFWRELYNPNPQKNEKNNYFLKEEEGEYWNKDVLQDPANLNFWIDFLDTDGELSKFSIPQIGCRPFVETDQQIKGLYFKKVPLAIFYDNPSDKNKISGYTYISMGKQNVEDFFDISTQGKSAKDKLNEVFYQNVTAQENINLSIIPIYYLQPNTIIKVKDEKNLDINGEYIIKRISYSLSSGSLMNVVADKVTNKLY